MRLPYLNIDFINNYFNITVCALPLNPIPFQILLLFSSGHWEISNLDTPSVPLKCFPQAILAHSKPSTYRNRLTLMRILFRMENVIKSPIKIICVICKLWMAHLPLCHWINFIIGFFYRVVTGVGTQ